MNTIKIKIVGFLGILFLVLSVKVFAQTPSCQPGDIGQATANGDLNCKSAKGGYYVIPSAATLASRAQKQILKKQREKLVLQQQELNQQALQEVIANDPKLSAQQAEITKSLSALKAQAN